MAGVHLGYLQWDAGNVSVICLRDEADRVVGTSTLGDFDLSNESAHIGWTAYAPEVWGTRVNAETKLLMLGAAFDNGFERVKLQADVLNARSRAAIERLGAHAGRRAAAHPAPRRRQLARHGGVLGAPRGVAGGAGRTRGPARPARPPVGRRVARCPGRAWASRLTRRCLGPALLEVVGLGRGGGRHATLRRRDLAVLPGDEVRRVETA